MNKTMRKVQRKHPMSFKLLLVFLSLAGVAMITFTVIVVGYLAGVGKDSDSKPSKEHASSLKAQPPPSKEEHKEEEKKQDEQVEHAPASLPATLQAPVHTSSGQVQPPTPQIPSACQEIAQQAVQTDSASQSAQEEAERLKTYYESQGFEVHIIQ